ncbi:carbamoyltransferase HypF [Leptolyngbya cf. ectocarpi LEGE 11479]|uniref:Carbamoyltransferase n=1 Tax=Leptolyngbya cf. ectocarpi LEGE 11479 TaxID=1828722 RepID=A0A928ZYM1_LEPEC|nr:carbamoyltransferase HypF [Leptolyngbya ectocarpi]MBE9069840.1 carbamoyltransferase HypF [Leptolyngbya cf. ectocarpi LEGE 11479]
MILVTPPLCRRRLTIRGTVQGVGFRPFVYQLASALGLAGGVKNTSQGVVIEIEGAEKTLQEFLHQLKQNLPPHAAIRALEQQDLPVQGLKGFQIWASEAVGNGTRAQILPDLATCAECLQDVFAPDNRRYQYPFTNCTYCGPRFSIIHDLPYDRCHTTMSNFVMCADCQAEYTQPSHRRFHAQPNACDVCGPHLEFWVEGKQQPGDPLQLAMEMLYQGDIVAVKGLGGFQLLADAHSSAAVQCLRERKGRPDKPLALMYSTLPQVRSHCDVSEAAAAVLTSAQAPIVLLPRRTDSLDLASNIAPYQSELGPYLGVMLPTTPIHHLLLRQYGSPLVTTSGNVSGEPIAVDEQASGRLGAIAPALTGQFADGVLTHNRPIQRPVDDSVVQLIQGRPQVLRHARGYAPQVIPLADPIVPEARILALGAHLKNTISLSLGDQIVLSQYIGDLDTSPTLERFQHTVTDFLALYTCQPTAIACDLHPDYGSTRLAHTLAEQWHVPLISVQHHYAHVLAGMAEHSLKAPLLGIAWDGTGYGLDQTVWGGEFLQITAFGFERVAHWLPFPLLGGELCSREPRRSALGLLYSCYGDAAFERDDLAPVRAFSASQRTVLRQMLTNQINTPMTSSIGRLFDGVAALLNLHQVVSFEGQAASALQFATAETRVKRGYPFEISRAVPHVIDWRPMVREIVDDHGQGVSTAVIAAKFHLTLVEIVGAIAKLINNTNIMLTGGCFQNKLLSEQTIQHLQIAGFTPYWHQRVPPNDGGIAVGQIIGAFRHLSKSV